MATSSSICAGEWNSAWNALRGNPHALFLPQDPERQAACAEQLLLGDLEEADVRAVVDDAERIAVAPAHAIENLELHDRNPRGEHAADRTAASDISENLTPKLLARARLCP